LIHLSRLNLHCFGVMVLCFSPPHPPVRCCRMTPSIIPPGRRYGYLSPSLRSRQLDQCSLFAMICWTLSTFYPVVQFTFSLFFLALCIVLLLSSLPTMFPPPLYLPRFIPSALFLPAFVNVFFNTLQSLSLSRRIISVSYLSATHLPLLSVLSLK